MSHFYAAITQSARKTEATARGHVSTGIETFAASWSGRVSVRFWHDASTGEYRFAVSMDPHMGHGDRLELCEGVVGDAKSVSFAETVET